jgi:hypothetical protein
MDNSSPVDMPVLTPSAPVNLPAAPGSIGLGEMGFIAMTAVWLLQTVLKQHTSQVSESWQMLESLVAAQQEPTNNWWKPTRSWILRLGRIHERLERLERIDPRWTVGPETAGGAGIGSRE